MNERKLQLSGKNDAGQRLQGDYIHEDGSNEDANTQQHLAYF